MFFSRRRGGAEPDANAASVPTVTSRGLDVDVARRLAVVFAAVDFVAARFAGAALPVDDFLGVFDGCLDRTGRSVMACTSLLIG